jgi:hypothetical protein
MKECEGWKHGVNWPSMQWKVPCLPFTFARPKAPFNIRVKMELKIAMGKSWSMSTKIISK